MIILASQSPRRREILQRLTADFIVCPSGASEDIAPCAPDKYVTELASRKASDVLTSHPGDTVVAADTIVCLDGRILGKPHDEQEARRYLRALSGREHEVYTGVAVAYGGDIHTLCEKTSVFFRKLTDELIDQYIESREPMDKAGAYGIQGIGGRFVRRIEGDFFNVMGLPLCALSCLFESLGIDTRGGRS